MAQVTVSDYEIRNDLLPAIWARCGEPAEERVDRSLRIIDGWKGPFLAIALIFGFFCFPPLMFTIIHSKGKRISVRLPLCDRHRRDHDWRRRITRRFLLPAWTAVALLLDVVAITEGILGGPGITCAAICLVLFFVVLIDALLVSRGAVKLAKPVKTDLQLRHVAPRFVEVLLEERARARVSDPDRRKQFGDVRDDYDEEAR